MSLIFFRVTHALSLATVAMKRKERASSHEIWSRSAAQVSSHAIGAVGASGSLRRTPAHAPSPRRRQAASRENGNVQRYVHDTKREDGDRRPSRARGRVCPVV